MGFEVVTEGSEGDAQQKKKSFDEEAKGLFDEKFKRMSALMDKPPFSDLSDIPDSVKKAERMQLKDLLPQDVIENFENNKDAFLRAVQLTENKPSLQRIVLKHGHSMLPWLAQQNPLLIFAHFDLSKSPYFDQIRQDAIQSVIGKGLTIPALQKLNECKDTDYLKSAIDSLTENYFNEVLANIELLKGPYFETILESAVKRVALIDPGALGEEIITTTAEALPGLALRYASNYKEKPWAAKIIKNAAEKMPFYAFKYADGYQDQPYAGELLKTLAVKDPRAALDSAYSYEKNPQFEQILESAVRAALEQDSHHSLFANADKFRNKPYAQEILFQAVTKSPRCAFEFVSNFKKEPYAVALLKTAAEKDQAAVFAYAGGYQEEPYAGEILLAYAAIEPVSALRNADAYTGNPQFKKVIELALRAALQKDPSAILSYSYLFKKRPDFNVIVENAVKQVLARNPVSAIQTFSAYKNGRNAKKYLREAIQKMSTKFPDEVLKASLQYKNDPDFRAVLDPALGDLVHATLEKDPGTLLVCSNLYEHQPYFEEILEKAARLYAQKSPKDIFLVCENFKNKPYAASILMAAGQQNPEAAVRHIAKYKDQPYAADIVSLAVEKDPLLIREYNYELKFMVSPDYLKKLEEKYHKTIERAERGMEIPEKTIQAADFPIERDTFDAYFLGMNQYSVKKTTDFFHPGYSLITIPMDAFKEVFYSPSFQQLLKQRAGKMSYMNAFSLAQAVYRRLEVAQKKIDDQSVREAATLIVGQLDVFRDRELLGSNTKLILFTHKEKAFNNEHLSRELFLRSGGKKENIVANEKGVEMKDGANLVKERVLQAIRTTKGPVTIVFNGHGSKQNWAFAENTVDQLKESLRGDPRAISYEELGDALYDSGNIEQVNLIGGACFAYDYLRNLFRYLEDVKQTNKKPYISISEANRSKFGWYDKNSDVGSMLFEALQKAAEPGKPITVDHFFKVEGKVWSQEDPALFVGEALQYEKREQVEADRPPEVRPMYPTGAIEALPPGPSLREKPEPPEEKPPEHYLEIGMGSTDFASDSFA